MGSTFVGPSYIVLVSLLTNAVFTKAQNGTLLEKTKVNRTVGCSLHLNNDLNDKEPKLSVYEEGPPLQIHIRIQILRIRDVPDSGGSFSVDMRYIFYHTCHLLITKEFIVFQE